METKKSKITRTVFKNEWTGQNGKVYYHEVELENGDKGQIGTKDKEPAKLNPGQELSYTIEKTDKGFRIKAVQENKGGGNWKQPVDPRVQLIGFSHAYAKDLCVGGKIEVKDLGAYSKKIFESMIECYKTLQQ